MYMETYSRRENLKFFGLPENSNTLDSSNGMEEESSRRSGTSENTREVLYKFLKEQLKIDRPRDKIRVSESSPSGEAKSVKSTPNHVTYSADTGQRYTLVSHALERCNKQHGFSMLHGVRMDHKIQ